MNHTNERDPDQDVVLGFKRITACNLTTQDITRLFGNHSEAEWIQNFNGPQLASIVPEPVRRLFELARGAMIYGRFYYPLLTIGYAECGRTLEAGARHAAHVAGLAPEPEKQRFSYDEILKRLTKAGGLTASEREHWNVGRELRNAFAHPVTSTIFLPGDASAKLRLTAASLNSLFLSVSTLRTATRESETTAPRT
jgi:hypothetical protein